MDKPVSTEFLVKTNKDVDEWMDGFYTEGRKADFRLHCQWAWQEQERRHNAVEAELLEALKNARSDLHIARFMISKHFPNHHWLSGFDRGVAQIDAAMAKVGAEQ